MSGVDTESLPRHIAIIMDGNGRWAQQRGQPRLAGHQAGAETVRFVLRYCRDAGIRYLTLYAFSKENWRRPAAETSGLMRLLHHYLRQQERELHENGVRLRVIGERADLPIAVQRAIERVEATTRNNSEGELILALSYGGRQEITRAARQLAAKVARGEVAAEAIDETALRGELFLPDLPDPDLIIRTSGEQRLSNFLLWQAAYSEFYVTPVYWPDFRKADFDAALAAYAGRLRRFGGLKSSADTEDTRC